MSYQIFTRNWWKEVNGDTLVPDPGALKRNDQVVETEAEAREICNAGNANRPKAWERLSRKYEYISL